MVLGHNSESLLYCYRYRTDLCVGRNKVSSDSNLQMNIFLHTIVQNDAYMMHKIVDHQVSDTDLAGRPPLLHS
jgi:hypothetical protein